MRRQRDSVLYERAQQPGLAARRIAQAGDAGAQPVGRGVRAIVIGITGIGQTQRQRRSEEHTSELQSLMRISYAVFCLKKKTEDNMKSLHVRQTNMTFTDIRISITERHIYTASTCL